MLTFPHEEPSHHQERQIMVPSQEKKKSPPDTRRRVEEPKRQLATATDRIVPEKKEHNVSDLTAKKSVRQLQRIEVQYIILRMCLST